MKKRIISFVMVILLVFALIPAVIAYADNTISVTVDGQQVEFPDQAPVIFRGRTLVPVRGVFEALGFAVSWDDAAQQVTMTGGHTVVLTIGSNTFTTDGVPHTLDVPAQMINDRTMLPIRAIVEAVGYIVDWDETTRTVIISYEFMDSYDAADGPEQRRAAIRRLEQQKNERLADLDKNGMRPLWYFERQFRNENPVGNHVESNFGLRYELLGLYKQIRPQITHDYTPINDPDRGIIYPENHFRWSDDTKTAIIAGKANESILTTRPYNVNFSKEVSSGIEFAFGQNDIGRTTGGIRILSPRQSTIGVKIRRTQRYSNEFAFVLLHEQYHAMGLCEGLTDLAAEEAMGIPSSVRELHGTRFLDGNMSKPLPGGFWYNSTPFRTLLRAMEADGRGDKFWAAVFHSNKEFARLWDEEMGHVMSWEDFSLFRAISKARFRNDQNLEQAFEKQMRITIVQAEQKFLDAWRILHNENEQGTKKSDQPNAQLVAQAQRDLNRLVSQTTEFAKAKRLSPAVAVIDREIRNHHVQFFKNQIEQLRAS